MKAISPLSGRTMEYRTEEWAKEQGYITNDDEFTQLVTNDYLLDFNETCWEIKVDDIEYYIKRK